MTERAAPTNSYNHTIRVAQDGEDCWSYVGMPPYNPRHVPAIIYDVVFVEGESIYIDKFVHDEHCLPYECVAAYHASA